MFSKTNIALSAAMVLSIAFPASAATKHHRVYNMVPAAQSDQIPVLDVNPVCHGIAMQGELEAGLQRTSFEQCVQSEAKGPASLSLAFRPPRTSLLGIHGSSSQAINDRSDVLGHARCLFRFPHRALYWRINDVAASSA